ncbi:MAG: FlgD immunoglobulin-like domain containing protein, partial [Candidatus Eisenbacteria bacterium]
TDNGGFSGDAIWAHGTPTAGGPFAGFSGTKCWGVGMFSDYGDMQHGYLTSPSYDFSDEQELRLSFHYWCETETDYDGAAVDVWNAAGSAWVRVTPLTGYTSATLGGIGYQNGWSGSTGGWVGTVFDITPYISSQVAFRVEFGSDQGVTGLGFWIDDIAFDTGDTFSSIDPPEAQGGIALFARGPNPFSGATRLALTLPAPQEIDLAVYDPAGRRVRTLAAGSAPAGVTEIGWDGRDGEGQILGSGVYFARMRTKTQTVLQKLILAQ